MIYEAKKLPEMEEEARSLLGSNINFRGSILIDLDSMESINVIKGDNIYFEFVVDIGGIRFTDAKIMTKDKKLWLPVETF
jgi:aspartate 1-decarboxylase